MFALLWKWIVSIFTADKIGIIVRIILTKAGSQLASDLLDVENQKKAYEFVKELHNRTDMTNIEKAQTFNLKMLDWTVKEGKKIADSTINCLREMALTALKTEIREAQIKNENSEK